MRTSDSNQNPTTSANSQDAVLSCVSARYKVEWSHHLCHPETCCHLGDYRVYDSIEKRYIDYSDDELELIKRYNVR